jgi:hypothetical protein
MMKRYGYMSKYVCPHTETIEEKIDMSYAGLEPLYRFKKIKHSGLTKREYFAAMAMQAFAVNYGEKDAAKTAVKLADALIKELEK